jgi:DUF4097 and DUF4098 domain-containing protein YvlB
MRRSLTSFFFLAMFAVPSAAIGAGTPVDESRPAAADGVVSIENMMGSIRVIGWAEKQVKVTGTLGEGVEGLEVDTTGDRTRIEVKYPHHSGRTEWNHRDQETNLEIKVPAGSDVRVEGVNLGVDVAGVTGELDLQSVNGNLAVRGEPKEVKTSTVNGTVTLHAAAHRISAETVNGALEITGGSGEMEASCVNGNIRVTGGSFQEANCSTVSGDIEWSAGMEKRGSLSLESHSGSVVLTLPRDIDAEFDVSTFSGKIVNELGPPAERTNEYAPGYELHFSLGSGESRVELSSFSGGVEIKAR